jgi:cytochrome P450
LLLAYYKKEDKANIKNVKTVRDFCRKLIEERKKDPIQGGADLLSILTEDEGYRNETEIIIDECITFFLAGSQTVKASNANILMHLALNPDIKKKVIAELKEKIYSSG